ncbi:hypothetical protein AB0E08_08420 [Streptomyces sp. NPDC048281]|uniref:hypothetical protein n=1 Tax=Streptomyces sp. NPDC048281 TaxID=3154715 RepID=UPI00343BECF8
MATPEQPQMIRLQGVGWMPATLPTDLTVGDQLMYNGGGICQITKITDATKHFLNVTEVSTETGEENTRRIKKSGGVVRAPEQIRRPLGHQDVPADSYRAQVRAPEHAEWVTVGHGATVADAINGLAPSRRTRHYFGTVMLDNHGLGYSKDNPDGRADSVKAMTDGETLTAADGHNFRILPPGQPQTPARPTAEETAQSTLPTLEGHTVTATLNGRMWTVSLFEDGTTAPLLVDKIGDHVNDAPAYAARELIRVREEQLKESAALLALDDETLYRVHEYRASTATTDPVTMTGREARARLQAAREEAGPERPWGHNTPRFTLEHSGAHWWTTTHAYKGGHRDQWNRRHITVRPLVVARAARVLMEHTGDGCIAPVEKPGTRAFGPWVRPVPNFPEQVVVCSVANGLHQAPQHEPAASNWAECMGAYRAALEGAGWEFKTATADGCMVFQEPATLA